MFIGSIPLPDAITAVKTVLPASLVAGVIFSGTAIMFFRIASRWVLCGIVAVAYVAMLAVLANAAVGGVAVSASFIDQNYKNWSRCLQTAVKRKEFQPLTYNDITAYAEACEEIDRDAESMQAQHRAIHNQS